VSLNTYGALQASIAGWLNRQNLTATIPDFIRLAEADIANVLRDRRMHRVVAAQTDCGSIEVPGDWLEAVDVRMVGADTPLRYLPPSEANQWRTFGPVASVTRFYSITGGTLSVLPAPPQNPDGTWPEVQMTYFARPPALSDDEPTNWVLRDEPGLYLYGSLLHAAPFLIDDERVPVWERAFSGRIETLNRNSDRALHSGGVLVRGRRGFG
jgi:hypothetical protein